MDLEQVKQFISAQGWIPQERKRQRGTLYLYAAKWNGELQKTMWRYIGTISRIDRLSEQEILAKLNK